jgi:hypothetical protein
LFKACVDFPSGVGGASDPFGFSGDVMFFDLYIYFPSYQYTILSFKKKALIQEKALINKRE